MDSRIPRARYALRAGRAYRVGMRVIGVSPLRLIGHLRGVVHRRPHLADLVIALIVYAAALLTTSGPHRPASLVLGAVATGALLARRRWPYLTLLVSTFAAELYLVGLDGKTGTLILAAPVVTLYTLAETSDRRRGLLLASGALVFVAGLLHTLGRPAKFLGPENIALVALGGLAVAAGEASRNRRAYLAEVTRRARDAERDREADARRRLAEERLRIARDLHDSVGHHLALINVQAGVAIHVLPDHPARETLRQIRQGSRAALDELRDTVGLLRDPAPLSPTVGLSALEDLLSSVRPSGLRVTVAADLAHPVPWACDVAAYRVVQESLTNVCKHAGPTDVVVSLSSSPDGLTVVVANDGPAAAVSGHGHGIVGMRERVEALGGTLQAGPRPTGGFRVSAVLPA
jgi:signal transduction histidine kinase